MTITMQNLERLTLAEMQEFLAGSRSIAFANQGREQIYRFVERILAAQRYRRLGKRQKIQGPAVRSPPVPPTRATDYWALIGLRFLIGKVIMLLTKHRFSPKIQFLPSPRKRQRRWSSSD